MNVSSYLFQSHYPQQIQIGRPDPQSAEESQTDDAQSQEIQKSKRDEKQLESYIKPVKSSVSITDIQTLSHNNQTLQNFQSSALKAQAKTAYTL